GPAPVPGTAGHRGARVGLVVPPSSSNPRQRGLVDYYCNLARQIALPLLIYHIPGRAAVGVELQTMERIVDAVPNVVGIKHATNDLGFVTQLLSRFGLDFRVFAGIEDLSFPMLAAAAP